VTNSLAASAIHHRKAPPIPNNLKSDRSRKAPTSSEGDFLMAYVITDSCIKDLLCVDVCPTDCIHPKKDEPQFEAATQLFVDPNGCIDCGACVPVCTSDSIHPIDDLPEGAKSFAEKNAVFFAN
jgi:ferredoxin